MPRKKTNQEFLKEVENIVGNEYIFLEKYVNNSTKIKVRHNCEKCNNYEYSVSPNKFLHLGRRCPKCSGNARKNTKIFEEELKEKFGNEYILESEYVNADTKVDIRHHKCNYLWSVRASDILNKNFTCPKCNGVAKKTNEIFLKEVKEITGDEYTFLEEYINNKTKIKVRHNCEKCNNYEYSVSPNRFLSGDRCPKCKQSRGEKKISEFLDSYNIVYKEQVKFSNCRHIKNLSFDFQIFYDDDTFILIEYDGEQHFKPSFGEKENRKQIERDKKKDMYCKENNIKLIRIKYTDFENIDSILREVLEL